MEHGLKQYIFVIRELTAREIKRKYSRSFLGIVWSVLQPLLFMVIMTAVFSGFLPHDINYSANYITGYTMWAMFKVSTITAMTTFEDNKNLFQKTNLPRGIFVLSRVYTGLVNLLFSCIALVIVLIAFRIRPHATIILFAVDVILELLFTVGIAYILSTIYVFYKDIQFFWKNLTVLLVHMVGVYFPIERYPENLIPVTKANPLFMYCDIARKAVIKGTFDWLQLRNAFLWSISVFLVGVVVFKIKENDMVKKL